MTGKVENVLKELGRPKLSGVAAWENSPVVKATFRKGRARFATGMRKWRHASGRFEVSKEECGLGLELVDLIHQRREQALATIVKQLEEIFHYITHPPGVPLVGDKFPEPRLEDWAGIALEGEWLMETVFEHNGGVLVCIDSTVDFELSLADESKVLEDANA